MADTILSLGGYTFSDFEVPEAITFGGTQRLNIKEMLGDVRIIDTLGPTEDDITWEGWLLGSDALDRAMQLDGMRYQGESQILTVFNLSYNVVIARFNFRIERGYQINYTLSLKVISNLNQQTLLQDVVDFTGAILGDLNTASNVLTGLNLVTPAVSNSLATLTAGIGTVNNFAQIGQSTVTNLSSQVTGTLGAVNAQIGTVKARIGF